MTEPDPYPVITGAAFLKILFMSFLTRRTELRKERIIKMYCLGPTYISTLLLPSYAYKFVDLISKTGWELVFLVPSCGSQSRRALDSPAVSYASYAGAENARASPPIDILSFFSTYGCVICMGCTRFLFASVLVDMRCFELFV